VDKLDYSHLQQALKLLQESIRIYDLHQQDAELKDVLRDSVIQRFEYSYELSIRMLRRTLEQLSDHADEIQQASFKELIRIAAKKGLLDKPSQWFNFRNKRNITSHTYNEDKAADVFAIIPEFYQAAHNLLQHLQEKS